MKILKKVTPNSLKVFFDVRMYKIFLLGCISGFPWVLIGSSLTLWLKEEGLSRSAIGWSGFIFAVYAVNYLWAPLVDKLKIPFFSKKLGHRKSWIFIMQFFIGICLVIWVFINPNENLFLVVLVGLLIAIFSATQDITIDALRIEQISINEKDIMAAGASVAVVGWWTGFKLGGLISLIICDFFEQMEFQNYWQLTFVFLTLILIIFNLLLLTINEKKSLRNTTQFDLKLNNISLVSKLKKAEIIIVWFTTTLINPIYSFFKKNGLKISIGILCFIFMFKIGEAFLGRMSIIFYKEMGFSKSDIGIFSKGMGWITTIFFTILGGVFTIKVGLIKAVFVAGIFMALTNILFSVLFWTGKNYYIFSLAVVLDDIAAAFATVAFVAFISILVNRKYTATQYALLASIGTIGRTILASTSGSIVDYLNGNWGIFFIITSVMVIPSLIILYFLKMKISFNK